MVCPLETSLACPELGELIEARRVKKDGANTKKDEDKGEGGREERAGGEREEREERERICGR
jgi:hypothetical protein